MSFNNYLSNLDELENLTYSTGFDIARFFLPDDEILKKILLEKNSKISEEELDIITSIVYEINEPNNQTQNQGVTSSQTGLTASINGTSSLNPTASGTASDTDSNSELNETTKRVYKEKKKALKEEVKKLKKEIREATFMLSNKQKEASRALQLATTNLSTSLPAALVLATAPPWNIPGAISLLLLVIKSYLDLLAIIQMVVPFFEPTRKLTLVIDSSKLNAVGDILNIPITALLAIFKPISIIQETIQKILEFIKNLFKNKNKVFKQATKRLIKLGHIAKINGERGDQYTEIDGEILKLSDGTSVTVYAKDESDVEEILSILNQFEIQDTRKWGGESHVYKFRKPADIDFDPNNPETLIDSLDKDINDAFKPVQVPTDLNEYQRFVYNIVLPDGTIIPNISEEGLNYYKSKYDLIYEF